MRMNQAMAELMRKHGITHVDQIPQNCAYPVWVKKDKAGRPYWGVSHFWNLDNDSTLASYHDFSQLEWDGNEVYLGVENEYEVQNILKTAVGILSFWKAELEAKYPETSFYLIASYDNGDMQILDEGESPTKSVTLRFWADRSNACVIDLSDFEDWEQPAILIHCNSK